MKLINPAPTKNNKPTALSPVYKAHAHLSLMQAQVYIYEIALQPVKVMGDHKARSIVLPGSLPLAPPPEGHLADETCRAGACTPRSPILCPFLPSPCEAPSSLPPPPFSCLQNDRLPVRRSLLFVRPRRGTGLCRRAWSSLNT